jgi:hypothetical protein
MSSMALHFFPILAFSNLRWNTMVFEKTLPESERLFVQLGSTFSWTQLYGYPLAFYFCWLACNYMINFVIAEKRIKERNYQNLYMVFHKKPWANKLLNRQGKFSGPILYSLFNAGFVFFTLHIGILCLKFEYLNYFLIWFWLAWSIWNSSCFYMDYFSKKYEASLQRLDQVEQQLNESQASIEVKS